MTPNRLIFFQKSSSLNIKLGKGLDLAIMSVAKSDLGRVPRPGNDSLPTAESNLRVATNYIEYL